MLSSGAGKLKTGERFGVSGDITQGIPAGEQSPGGVVAIGELGNLRAVAAAPNPLEHVAGGVKYVGAGQAARDGRGMALKTVLIVGYGGSFPVGLIDWSATTVIGPGVGVVEKGDFARSIEGIVITEGFQAGGD